MPFWKRIHFTTFVIFMTDILKELFFNLFILSVFVSNFYQTVLQFSNRKYSNDQVHFLLNKQLYKINYKYTYKTVILPLKLWLLFRFYLIFGTVTHQGEIISQYFWKSYLLKITMFENTFIFTIYFANKRQCPFFISKKECALVCVCEREFTFFYCLFVLFID